MLERRRPAFVTAPTWRPLHSPTIAADLTRVDVRTTRATDDVPRK